MEKTYSTIKQLAEKHKAFPVRKLRYLVLKRKTNGFDAVVRRIGKSVILEDQAFEQWVSEQVEHNNSVMP